MPISPSGMPYPTRLNSEPTPELVERVIRYLNVKGELGRLTAYIPGRLAELGWCERVLELCREFVRKNSASGLSDSNVINMNTSVDLYEPSAIPVDDIVKAVTPDAKLLLPRELKMELINHIVDFIAEHNLD